MKSLGKNSIYNVIYTVSNLLFLLVTSVYVSRVLLADGVGHVAYAQNISSYFVTIAILGLPTYGVREIAKAKSTERNINKVFTELFVINLISTALSSIAYFVLVISNPSFREDWELMLCCGLQIVLNCFNIDWLYQGLEEYGYIAARSCFVKLLSLGAILLLVKSKDDYIVYAALYTMAICGNYLFNIIHSRKIVKLCFDGLNFRCHIAPLMTLAVSVILSSIYTKIDITMLGKMCSDTVVGLYSNAHKAVDIIITLCVAFCASFLPRLSNYYKTNKTAFVNLMDLGIRLLCFLAIPMAAAIYVMAPDLVRLVFGESFSEAAVTVRIFSVLIIVKSFGNLLCYQLIIVTGNEKKRLPAYFASAILNIIMNAVLIPYMAQNGAAIASVLSELVVNGIQFAAMRRIVRISFSRSAIFQSVLSTVAMVASIVAVGFFAEEFFVRIILSVMAGVSVYFVANYYLGNSMIRELLCGLGLLKKGM